MFHVLDGCTFKTQSIVDQRTKNKEQRTKNANLIQKLQT
jgi:hypothetical protein